MKLPTATMKQISWKHAIIACNLRDSAEAYAPKMEPQLQRQSRSVGNT